MYIKNTLAEKVKEVIENKKFEELIERMVLESFLLLKGYKNI